MAARRMDGRTPQERFWNRVDKSGGPDACWPWTGRRDAKGYGRAAISREIRGDNAHRLAWKFAAGDPGDLLVCHRCDNPPCCNPAHLFLGTPKDNARDMAKKWRGRHKLTRERARELVLDRRAGMTLKKLSRKFRVSESTVLKVIRREEWAQVTTIDEEPGVGGVVHPSWQR